VLVAVGMAIAALRPMLGRADGQHFGRYGVFAAIPMAWLVMRCWRSPFHGPALGCAMAAWIGASIHPIRSFEDHLESVESAARRGEDMIPLPIPRSGGARLPASSVDNFVAFRRFLDAELKPGETFFDYSNQPGLYFIADRRLPIRYITVAQYEAPDRQEEVVAALERERPPIAILPSGIWGDLDGVSNAARTPRVAKYIEEHYAPVDSVGGWRIGRRRDPVP
jgi:hypothetical protein